MMKLNSALLLAVFLISISCSTDKDNTMIDETSLNGRWDATELRVDENTATDDERNARDLMDFLTARDCYVISLQFNQDLTLRSENSLNYLEINMNSSGTGLDIPCPEQTDILTTTYSFDGRVLTIIEEDGTTTEAEISLDGNLMILDASTLDIPEFTGTAQLVFVKR